MKKFLTLEKTNLKLSIAEALAIIKPKNYNLIGNLLITSTNKKLSRLALTKAVYKLLFITTKKELIKKINSFNWQKEYKKNFRVKTHNYCKEREIADLVWSKLKNPKVNLTNPATSFEFFFIKNKAVVVGKKLYDVHHDFEKRSTKHWPAHHPTSMKPKLARTIINLTGIEKGTFYDVMCGAGGFLIEAGLMGFKVVGYDINKVLIKKAEENLKHYKIKNFVLKRQDATKIKHKIKYLAVDLPYGRATPTINREELYLAFLKNLKKILTKTAVIVFPHYSPYKNIIKQAKLKINQEFSVYTHHTLTRKIIVINN